MKVSLKCFVSLLVLVVLFSSSSHAEDRRGELSVVNWSNAEGTIKIPVIKVKYTLTVFFGEPTETFFFYYEPIDDFTRINTIKLRAQVVAGGNLTGAYIDFDPLVDQPKKWGWDVPGSADWGKMFHNNNGGLIDKDKARQFFKDGISLTDLEVIDMYASSGVDDAEYDAFGAQIPTSYVSNKGSVGQLDRLLPPTNFGGAEFGDGTVQNSWADSNMWKKRLTSSDFVNQWSNVTKENVKSLSLTGMTHTTWKYNLYQHAAIELVLSDYAFKEKPSQEISIDIVWEDWSGGKRRQVQKRTFTKTLKPDQRMTAVDRVLRKRLDDGSLSTYHVSYRIRFHDMEEEEVEDPLDDVRIQKLTFEKKLEQIKTLRKTASKNREKYERELQARRTQAKADWDSRIVRKRKEQNILLPDPVITRWEKVEETPDIPEPLLEEAKVTTEPPVKNVIKMISPADGFSTDDYAILLRGQVDPSLFNPSNGDSLTVSCLGLTQRVTVDASGAFKIPVFLAAGENDIRVSTKFGADTQEVTRKLTLNGEPSKYTMIGISTSERVADYMKMTLRSFGGGHMWTTEFATHEHNEEKSLGESRYQSRVYEIDEFRIKALSILKFVRSSNTYEVEISSELENVAGKKLTVHTFKNGRFLKTYTHVFQQRHDRPTTKWSSDIIKLDRVYLD